MAMLYTDEQRYVSAEMLGFLNKLGIVKDAQINQTTIGALAIHLSNICESYGLTLERSKTK